jgi:hypothetical protein
MEGLRSRRQAALDDAAGNGVLAPFLPTRVAEGVRQNPVFWFPRKPIPRALPPALPAAAGERVPAALRLLGNYLHLALPQLRRRDDCHPQTCRCGAFAVRLLRYLLMLRTTADHRRARGTPADLCARPSPNRSLATFSGPPFERSLSPVDSLQRSNLNFRFCPSTHLSFRQFKSSIHFP